MPEVTEAQLPQQAEVTRPLEKISEYPFQRRESIDEENKPVFAYQFNNKNGQSVEAIFYSRGAPTTGGDLTQDRFVVPVGSLRTLDGKEKTISQAVKVIPSEQTNGPLGPDYNKALSEGKVTYLVESSPRGLIDLYTHLGGDDPQLREARRDAVVNWRFKPEVLKLMDKVIAGNIVTSSGEVSTKRLPQKHEGETLTILEMQGDEKAKEVLDKKQKDLQKNDVDHRINEMDRLRKVVAESGAKGFDINKLALVHVTSYEPKLNPDTGKYEIRSTFDATHGLYPRTTVHFSLNHPVESHNYGAWEGKSTGIVIPFKAAIETDGKPAVLSTLDTFWEVPTGGGFELPEGTVVAQAGNLREGLAQKVKTENGVTFVRYNTNLSSQVVEQLMHRIGEYKENAQVGLVSKMVNEVNDKYMEAHNWESAHPQVLAELSNLPTNLEEVTQIVKNQFSEEYLSKIDSQWVQDIVRGSLIAEVRNLAIKDVLSQQDFPRREAIGAEWMPKPILSATALGVGALSGELITHNGHPTHYAEDNGGREMWGDSRAGDVWDKMDQYSENQRRALYLSGVL